MADIDELLSLVRSKGIIRARDLEEFRLTRKNLQKAVDLGLIVRLGRGLYADADVQENPDFFFAQVCKQIPAGVVCLVSALQFHKLGTQTPSEIWIAIPRHSYRPFIDYPPVNLVEFSPAAYELGIQHFDFKQTDIRVYSIEKTVVDCFRFRNQLGMDVALEALKEYLARPGVAIDKLMQYAVRCHISTVIDPYVKALQ